MEKYRTRTVGRTFFYQWEIIDFTSLVDTPNFGVSGTEYKSPKFSVNTSFFNEWHLELSMTEKRFVVILISNSNERIIRTQYSFSILNNKKEKKFTKLQNYLFTEKAVRGPEMLIYKHEILNNESEFLPDNVLTICIDLTVYNECSEIIKFPSMSLKYSIVEDLKKLLDNNVASDITLVVNGKEYQAHKAIFMARSPVFFAMLIHDMKEKKEDKVNVPDINQYIFEKIFEYVYSDKVTDLDSCAEQLLEIADQYQLLGLVELCEESLGKSLVVENAIKILALADKFNAHQLFEFTVDFIHTHLTRIKNTPEYKEVINKSNPYLTMKLVERFAAI